MPRNYANDLYTFRISGGGAQALTLTVTNGTLTLSGQTVTLKVDRKLSVVYNTLTLPGKDVTLKADRKLSVTYNSLTLSGQSISLAKSSSSAILLLDKLWIKEPRLLLPKRKPLGQISPIEDCGEMVFCAGFQGMREQISGKNPSYSNTFSYSTFGDTPQFISGGVSSMVGLAWESNQKINSLTNQFTILMAWTPISYVIFEAIFSKIASINDSGAYDFAIYQDSSTVLSFKVNTSSGEGTLSSPLTITNNQRRCDVCVYDGSQLRFYTNGMVYDVTNHTGNLNTDGIYLGFQLASSFNGARGNIECAAVFNKAWPESFALKASKDYYNWVQPI